MIKKKKVVVRETFLDYVNGILTDKFRFNTLFGNLMEKAERDVKYSISTKKIFIQNVEYIASILRQIKTDDVQEDDFLYLFEEIYRVLYFNDELLSIDYDDLYSFIEEFLINLPHFVYKEDFINNEDIGFRQNIKTFLNLKVRTVRLLEKFTSDISTCLLLDKRNYDLADHIRDEFLIKDILRGRIFSIPEILAIRKVFGFEPIANSIYTRYTLGEFDDVPEDAPKYAIPYLILLQKMFFVERFARFRNMKHIMYTDSYYK